MLRSWTYVLIYMYSRGPFFLSWIRSSWLYWEIDAGVQLKNAKVLYIAIAYRCGYCCFRGYPCSLWTMFHALSVNAYLRNLADSIYQPKDVIRLMQTYARWDNWKLTLFNHWQKMNKLILSAPKIYISSSRFFNQIHFYAFDYSPGYWIFLA